MSENIKLRTIDGWAWNTVIIGGKLYLLRRLGRNGECICP